MLLVIGIQLSLGNGGRCKLLPITWARDIRVMIIGRKYFLLFM